MPIFLSLKFLLYNVTFCNLETSMSPYIYSSAGPGSVACGMDTLPEQICVGVCRAAIGKCVNTNLMQDLMKRRGVYCQMNENNEKEKMDSHEKVMEKK